MAPLFQKNVELNPPLQLTAWRKVAIGTWRTAGDPSVYGILELDAEAVTRYLEKLREKSGRRVTFSHIVGKAIANTMARHPEINCILRFGQLYPRKAVDVFFQVATDDQGKDLSGMTIRHADQKSILEICDEMEARVKKIRDRTDTSYTQMKSMMGRMPGWLTGFILNTSGFLMYTLNLFTPLFGVPRDSFGGVMITNIGSLGMHTAFAPLVPYSRVPILIALGAVEEVPVVRGGAVVVGKVIRLCATFDHRLIDGVHASKMAHTMRKIFANPEAELGAP